MKNLFNPDATTQGIRMYSFKDGTQRFYARDLKYHTYCNEIRVLKTAYTITGLYSYAVLDMYRETIISGYCSGTTEIDTSSERARYITVCGLVSAIDAAMVLDAPISETGDNPEYVPYTSPSSDDSPTVILNGITTVFAEDFTYDSNTNSYSISSMSPEVTSYDDLGKEFTLYGYQIDNLYANSSISLFGHNFKIYHVNDLPLETDMRSVPSVMPFLCNKETGIAKMIYSYVTTSQTGFGIEDVFLDVEGEPFDDEG